MRNQVLGGHERLDFVWLEITARCNLECIHCYADSGPQRALDEGMRPDDWVRALDEAAALGCRKVQFIGGEPTLHPDLPRLIGHARAIGYEQVCVYTNGTHFTEALKETFVSNRVSLAFSVYGSTGAVHDQVTRRNGSFAKTGRAVRWAVEVGLAVRAGIIGMGVNAHDVVHAERMLREAGVQAVHVDRLRGLGRGSNERPPRSRMQELCGRCGNGKLCVSSTGEIYPCVFARFAALGHFKTDGLNAAFAGRGLREFREELIGALGGAAHTDSRGIGAHAPNCSPEEPAPPCTPEEPAPPCTPEKDPGKCNPEIDPGPCFPETGVRMERAH